MFGAVIAGGSARRLGSDKALLMIGGQPLWQRQAITLRAAGATSVALIRRSDQFVPEGIAHGFDSVENAGPLAGLQAAFQQDDANFIAVLAVDMPGITAEWFQRLRHFCRPGVGAVFCHAEAFEPLAAIYPREATKEIAARLVRRQLSLQDLIRALVADGRMRLIDATLDEVKSARGINTPEDLSYWLNQSCSNSGLSGSGDSNSLSDGAGLCVSEAEDSYPLHRLIS